ncbi:hypothetical protein N0V82_006012 [Gnomoniopsis sp. IMI 355080]|nr:hypothetical protein N0V82_006012 [Gnomoniopsis sp. IMI 355080]
MEDIYSYPLDHRREEIRLLELTPGSPGSSVEIKLSTVSLSASPRYHALSYVWGDPSRSHKIISNGRELRITRNLEVALRHLRSHLGTSVEALPLWVDAICINQSNLLERNEQVAMMGRIFSQAFHVLIWLGEGDEYSDELFDYLEDPNFLQSLEEARRTQGRGPTQQEIRASAIFDNSIDESPWWGRIWVLQEMVLAHQEPVVLSGTRRSSWDTMFNCRKWLSSPCGPLNSQSWIPSQVQPEIPSLSFNSVMSHHWHWASLRDDYQRKGPLPLHDALLAIRDAKATDKRDFVYGLLGLMIPEDAGKVIIDYAKPPMFIYKSVMEHVWTCGNVDLLSEVIPRLRFARCSESEGWPSWVPNLSEQRLDASTAFLLGSSTHSIDLSAFSTTPDVSLSEDKSAISVAGVALDTICNVFDLTALDDIDVETLRCIAKLLAVGWERQQFIHSRLEGARPLSQPKESIGCFMSGWTLEEIRPVIRAEEKSATGKPPGENQTQDEDTHAGAQVICRYWPSIPATHPFRADTEGRLCGRKIFLTNQGFPGIGTPDVREGDLVMRPFGADCHYVLRPRRSDGPEYTLMGFAYLSVSMELVAPDQQYREGALKARSFTIF